MALSSYLTRVQFNDIIKEGKVNDLRDMFKNGRVGKTQSYFKECLHWTVFHNQPDCLRILIENGADVSYQTALHVACRKGFVECVRILLSAGAPQDVLNIQRESPFDKSSDEIRGVLKEFQNRSHESLKPENEKFEDATSSAKPHFPLELFVSVAEAQRFQCAICLDVAIEPVYHSTQDEATVYCRSCISMWLSKTKTCPTCKKAVSVANMAPLPRLLMSVYNDLKCYCSNRDKGCDCTLTFSTLCSHICPKRIVSCENSNSGCEEKVMAENLADHMKECPFRVVSCKNKCQELIMFRDVDKHQESCSMVNVSCCYCGTSMLRSSLASHLKESCTEIEICCSVPGCPAKMKQKDKEQHEAENYVSHIRFLSQMLVEQAQLISNLTTSSKQ